MKILIADDDRLSAAMLQRTVEVLGLEVVVVTDGAAAWQAIEHDPAISLAIIDWMMPSIEGPELCRRIRRDAARAHLYVLLVTSRGSRADIITGLAAGADDYLAKPYDPEELRVRLNAGLRVMTLQQRLAERVRQLEAAASSIVQLHGLLPICTYCKNVRSDQNYWQQVEEYIGEHSALQFSHGICPSCYDVEMTKFQEDE